MAKMTKATRIKRRITSLNTIYSNLPQNERILLQPTIDNVANMEIQLEELRDLIATEGTVDTYQNGNNQFGQKPSANLQSYNQLMKTYLTAIKQLQSALPKESGASKLQAFMNE